MKKKKLSRPSSSSAYAAAILAGGVLFTGPAAGAATIVFSENFEESINAFGMGTYAYSSNFTMPNYLMPDGGLLYATGGTGITNQVSTNFFFVASGPISLTQGSGVSAGEIDSGLATYDFRAQFSTYRFQNDFAEVSITFQDAFSSSLGAPIILGGEAFIMALAAGQFGNYSDARAWGESAFQGAIPVGARTIDVLLSSTKSVLGTAIDSYVDNVTFYVATVPEPTTFALAACAGLACLRRRRR